MRHREVLMPAILYTMRQGGIKSSLTHRRHSPDAAVGSRLLFPPSYFCDRAGFWNRADQGEGKRSSNVGSGTGKPAWRAAANLDAVVHARFVDRLGRHPEALGQHRAGLVALLDHRPHLWCRRSLLLKMNQHVRAPSRMSYNTDFAMKRADRRGKM